MPKYLFIGTLNSDGVKGVLAQGGTARAEAVRDMITGVGGTLESFYFGFGSEDSYVIADLPDNASAAAVAMNVSASGTIAARTVVLLTPAEVDDAAKRHVDFRPPGR